MPSGLITHAVANLEPLPQIQGPETEVAAPEGSIVGDPDVRAASARTLRVTGIACGYGVEGSGWVAGRDLVVTNAHVVAGETATHVQVGGLGTAPARRGRRLRREERHSRAARRRSRPDTATPYGTPARPSRRRDRVPRERPARHRACPHGPTEWVTSSDAYDRGPVQRVVTSFRVYVRPGNSGGPAVNENGRVVSTIFASRTGSDNSGFGIPSRIVHRHLRMAADRTNPVSTRGCAN